jgi:hypothetical protein
MPDIYIGHSPDPAGKRDTFSITADQLEVAKLQPSQDIDGEWVLSSAGPVAFNNVSFRADNEDKAISDAKGWVDNYIRTERPDLMSED